MTDNTIGYTSDYKGGVEITCILDEGAPTVSERVYGRDGTYDIGLTWANEIKKDQWVAISNDSAVTAAATNGVPVLEKPVNAETLTVGFVKVEPRRNKMPPNSAAADTLAKRLAGGYYRYATVVLMGGITAVMGATVTCDGTNATVPGVGTTLKYNITSGVNTGGLQLDSAASGGAGVIPFHNVPAGTNGDKYSCTVGLTALLPSVTGE